MGWEVTARYSVVCGTELSVSICRYSTQVEVENCCTVCAQCISRVNFLFFFIHVYMYV
jgi:hypothetical protein